MTRHDWAELGWFLLLLAGAVLFVAGAVLFVGTVVGCLIMWSGL